MSVAKKVRPEIFGLHGLDLALGLLASGRPLATGNFLEGAAAFFFPLVCFDFVGMVITRCGSLFMALGFCLLPMLPEIKNHIKSLAYEFLP